MRSVFTSRRARTGVLALALSTTFAWASACGGGDEKGGKKGAGDGDGDTSTGAVTGEGGEASTDELILEARYPAVDDANANALLPITLTFDEDIDDATLSGALRIQSGGRDLEVIVSSDGPVVTIDLVDDLSLPARVTISVSSKLTGTSGASFSGDAWTFTYPLWQTPEGDLAVGMTPIHYTVLGGGVPFAAFESDGSLSAAQHDGSTWVSLATGDVSGGGSGLSVLGAAETSAGPTVAWRLAAASSQQIHVGSYDGGSYAELGDGPALSGDSLDAVLVGDPNEAPIVVAHVGGGSVQSRVLSAGGWQDFDEALPVAGATVHQIAATVDGDRLVVAVLDSSFDIAVYESSGSGWEQIGNGVDRSRTSDPVDVHLHVAAQDGKTYVAYLDGDDISTHFQVAEFEGTWGPAGSALDLEMNNQVLRGAMTIDSDGAVHVGWIENVSGRLQAITARREGAEWRVLGEAIARNFDDEVVGFELATDGSGNLHAVISHEDGPIVRRFNGSPTLPHGLAEMGDRGACAIPETDDPNFPTTLSATGCYENVATHQVVAGAIPFNINSILWSDRAYKKRYVLLPEGGTVDFYDETAFIVPVGTIVIKEFYLEKILGDPSTLRPVETRFLVKRCDPAPAPCSTSTWEGYSYMWNDAGNSAVLLDGETTAFKDWDVDLGGGETEAHTHTYPARSECQGCHNTAGRLLGVTGAQLNRPQDYDGIIENQLRAWNAAGLFGDTAPSAGEPESWKRLPSPPDVGRSLQQRTLAYFQSNCSHCHRPGGDAGASGAADFRYYGPGLVPGGNICDKLGTLPTDDASTATLYFRDSLRDEGVQQMPPIATLLVDEQQLPVTKMWIESLPASICQP